MTENAISEALNGEEQLSTFDDRPPAPEDQGTQQFQDTHAASPATSTNWHPSFLTTAFTPFFIIGSSGRPSSPGWQ
jgi:hypothetical protein